MMKIGKSGMPLPHAELQGQLDGESLVALIFRTLVPKCDGVMSHNKGKTQTNTHYTIIKSYRVAKMQV